MTLKAKMLVPLILGVVAVSVGLILFLTYFFNQAGESEVVESARSLIIAAEGAKENTSSQHKMGVFKHPVKDSLTGKQYLAQIPIVVAMNIAKAKASDIGATVRIPSDNYRNADNSPTPMEQDILTRFRTTGSDEIIDKDYEGGVIRYFKPIRLEKECLTCHGDPDNPEHNIWGRSDGMDITGNRMENMEVGDLKGMYAVAMPMSLAEAMVDDNIEAILIGGIIPIIIMLIVGVIIFRSNMNAIKHTSEKVVQMRGGFEEGDLSTRADPDSVDPVFRDLMTSTNVMVESLINPLNTTNDYINRIAAGEIPPRYVDDVKGEFNKTKNSINSLVNILSGYSNEIKRVSKAHYEGYINEEINTDSFPGIYKEMSIMVNELVDQHISMKKQVMGIVEEYANGNFEAELPIQANDRKFLNDALDGVKHNLVNFNQEIVSVINNISQGNISFRGNPENYQGDWSKLVEGLNSIVENFVHPFEVTINKLDDIAKGRIDEKVTEDFSGDFNRPKVAMNHVIDTLQKFSDEMHYVHKQHDAGEIDEQMDPQKFQGSFSDMASGVNDLVNSHINMKKHVLGIVSQYGDGNFEATLEPQPGKRKFLNDALNSVQDNLYGISDEISSLIEAAKKGDLDKRGDLDKFNGGWEKIISSLNELMETISEPINESGVVLSKYSKGELTERMHGNYAGSFEDLKDNINTLGISLTDLISQVKDSVDVASSTAKQLSETSNTIKEASYEQSSQTDDVASAVEEMSRTVTENAVSAGQTAEIAIKNKAIASEGGEIVRNTLKKMHDIATIVTSSASEIKKLGASSQKIGEIISVIEDIADQTNLLALNAAIEAARAGEQGRGFAVVADEVRKLAERTTDATKQISEMINGIQSETTTAVDSMNKGSIEVQTGIELADSAGDALTQIESSSNEVLDMINQIAAANDQQSSTSEEISKNVLTISEVIGDSARQVEEIAQSAVDLNNLTVSLEQLMSQFKISADRNGRGMNASSNGSSNGMNLSSLARGRKSQLSIGNGNGNGSSNGHNGDSMSSVEKELESALK